MPYNTNMPYEEKRRLTYVLVFIIWKGTEKWTYRKKKLWLLSSKVRYECKTKKKVKINVLWHNRECFRAR